MEISNIPRSVKIDGRTITKEYIPTVTRTVNRVGVDMAIQTSRECSLSDSDLLVADILLGSSIPIEFSTIECLGDNKILRMTAVGGNIEHPVLIKALKTILKDLNKLKEG